MLKPSNAAHQEHKEYGRQAELFVAQWLKKQGYEVLAHNYRQRYGEIDIIVKKPQLVAFVEVKFRSHDYFNTSEVIIPSKQKKIIKTAQAFIAHQVFEDTIFRFDIALVSLYNGTFQVEYIANAFTKESM